MRVQDLKKAASTDQAEIKDLRAKLRMCEHERAQLAGKQGEAGELKKALQSLESKRKDELRERDRKIAELEKCLAGETRRRESAETRLQELKGKGDQAAEAAHAESRALQAEAAQAREEREEALVSLETLREEAATKEEALVEQVEQHRILLGVVSEEYARLASCTVPASTYARTKHEHTVLQLRTWRLERKLANSEGQVVELANLIRQTKDANTHLARTIQDTEAELSFAWSLQHAPREPRADPTLHTDLAHAIAARRRHDLEHRTHELTSQFYALTADELLLAYSHSEHELHEARALLQERAAAVQAASAARDALAAELQTAREAQDAADELRARAGVLQARVTEIEEKLRADAQLHATALNKEKDKVRRATEIVQKSQMAEDGLRAEIDQCAVLFFHRSAEQLLIVK